MNLKQLTDKPIKTTAISAVLLFWMLTPLIAQKYFQISAINTSFTITVAYFIVWKLYNNKTRILDILQ